MSQKLHSQEENKIDVLLFPSNVRSVAGMYVGDTGDCSNILREAVDNAIDELEFVPTFNQIIIHAADDGSNFMVADWGRGMPIEMNHQFPDETSARVATSKVNAGGKFDKTRISAGMNGTGIKTTNALSDRFVMLVKLTKSNTINSIPEVNKLHSDPDGFYYFIEYHKGIYDREGVIKDSDSKKFIGLEIPENASTVVYFEPDYSLIPKRTYKLPIYNFRYKAFLMKEYSNRDISILCNGKEMVSLPEMYKWKVKHRFSNLPKAKKNKSIDICFSFELSSDLRSRTYKGSVNSLVVNNGLHIKMVVESLRKAISKLTGCENSYKLESGFKIRSILQAVKVDFTSQIKENCNVIDGYSSELVDELVPDILKILEKNKKIVQDYVKRIQELDQTYRRLKDKQYIESRIKHASGSKKLTNTSRSLFAAGSTDRKKCELFVCFTGDTEIRDCNNQRIRFDELAKRITNGESIYTFSCGKRGKIYPAKIIACKEVKKINQLVEVELDNGEKFRCTPDHQLMMRNGEYIEAKDCTPGLSMMPCYIKLINNRRCIKVPKSQSYDFRDSYDRSSEGYKFYYIYRIMSMHSDTSVHESVSDSYKIDIHHIDNNQLNDTPLNLLRCGNKHHLSFHREKGWRNSLMMRIFNGEKDLHDRLYKKLNPTRSKMLRQDLKDPIKSKIIIDRLRNNALKSWRDKKDSIMAKRLETIDNKLINFVGQYIESNKIEGGFNESNFNKFKSLYKIGGYHKLDYKEYKLKYPELFENWESKLNSNHKIKSIRFIDCDQVPVYCLEVDDSHHNFPLAAGIFVKNCEGLSASGALVQAPQRDPMIHAVYGIRGRVLNANNLSLKSMLRNDEMAKLLNIIGMGVNGFVNIKNQQYGKIIICTDGDFWGSLIYSGLLANLATHASFLFELGLVYLAESPKYEQGNKFIFPSNEDELNKSKPYSAIKGLGKLNPDEAGEVFFNPKTRRLIKITPEHVNKARAFLDKKSWVRRELAEKNGWLTGVFEDEDSDED